MGLSVIRLCKTLLVLGAAFAGGLVPARATLLPPQFFDCVAAIGVKVSVVQPGQPQGQLPSEEFRAIATGFFYGFLIKDDPDPLKRLYETYLITAKHVIDELRTAKLEGLFIRVNPAETSSQSPEFAIPLRQTAGQNQWFFDPDPNVDLASIRIQFPILRASNLKVDFFPNDQIGVGREQMKSRGVAAGDGIFVLGFPLGLNGRQRNYLTVRQGVIARLSDMLEGASKSFLIDSFAFPGNSGGPVILKPELTSLVGTSAQRQAVIGIVLSYIPYIDTAISEATKRPRVTFEENSGLANVLPVGSLTRLLRDGVR